ncbi:cytochrome c biogenesis protein ResB [Micrococcoides hystricis]|uniref:Cytochrome c biogenesis protein ResB n=1 Tax=Micrococcoides hystricis TaxID=1572761 RepID=A0ABV6PD69_9MICC
MTVKTTKREPLDPRREVKAPALGPLGMLRWAWAQLTNMRTAIMLLLLLAVAAVPGSLFPQRPADPDGVAKYLEDYPTAGPILDFFQLFDVYSSVWFSAIYLLLFISLIGCIWPRTIKHYRVMRSEPVRTPRYLHRLPVNGAFSYAEGTSATQTAEKLAEALRKRNYRAVVREEQDAVTVSGERGYLREVGNLLFHVSMLGVLISVGIGGLFGYNGQRIITQGESWANTLVSYDNFYPGSAFSENALAQYRMRLDDFEAVFDRQDTSNFGMPLDFTAYLTTQEGPDAEEKQETLKVNSPLTVGATSLYLVGNGYAPEVVVKDGDGNVAMDGTVIARPTDSVYTSLIVIKAPDAKPEQLGFVGFLLPTSVMGEDQVAFSGDPELLNPELNLNSYYGDLGLDEGIPGNVYVLDTDELTELNSRSTEHGGIVLKPGESYQLPEGKGSIEFKGIKRYIAIDIHYDPGKYGALIFSVLAMVSLAGSLFIRRRRAFFRVPIGDNGTRAEYGLLARGEDFGLAEEAEAVLNQAEKTLRSPLERDLEEDN